MNIIFLKSQSWDQNISQITINGPNASINKKKKNKLAHKTNSNSTLHELNLTKVVQRAKIKGIDNIY